MADALLAAARAPTGPAPAGPAPTGPTGQQRVTVTELTETLTQRYQPSRTNPDECHLLEQIRPSLAASP